MQRALQYSEHNPRLLPCLSMPRVSRSSMTSRCACCNEYAATCAGLSESPKPRRSGATTLKPAWTRMGTWGTWECRDLEMLFMHGCFRQVVRMADRVHAHTYLRLP